MTRADNHTLPGASRIRNVPIQIEPRAGSTRQMGDSSTNHDHAYNNQSNRYNYDQHQHFNPEPYPPFRRPSPNGPVSNNAYGYQSDSPQSARDTSSTKPVAQDTERSVSANGSVTDPDIKLVNSPTPIPLPGPEISHQDDQHSNQNQSNIPETHDAASVRENLSLDDTTTPAASAGSPVPQQTSTSTNKKELTTLDAINNIRMDVSNLLKKIYSFDDVSATSKDYRYLDEMLTRCMLNLDDLQCGDSSELRQLRKATIKHVDKATDILQRKLQINSDIQELSKSMKSV